MAAATALRPDATLRGGAEAARAAAAEVAGPDAVGDHLGMEMVEERLGTHYFAAAVAAYRGWRWAVSVARVPRSKTVTVCEVDLVPGDGALLSPEWVPYASRLAPGDLGPGDVTPFVEDDPLLEPGFEATGDEDVDAVALWELGLGRPRVLSAEGRDAAAQRWYDGEHGPAAPLATKAAEACATCGFFLPMAGALRTVFGVCANAWSPSDGSVVSLDHGCGAHSEVDVEAPAPEKVSAPILDDDALDVS
ncbi:DUF3027 domain-containing protein [Phycicoccus sp. CSK15P-2]|uniref:DUF3027 domain-containing protein n=1 Tax=Phycicoccus sp. CSK15P-2 TaxID=2807627 RepID=UPI0019504291|nr:DUF3027 domain-containing protein [Phycicoccus sp. CSK15P-2]MBM6403251.1 DUF3027 domain-containing protein [Phycicoccus sp. CSK15P-2]